VVKTRFPVADLFACPLRRDDHDQLIPLLEGLEELFDHIVGPAPVDGNASEPPEGCAKEPAEHNGFAHPVDFDL